MTGRLEQVLMSLPAVIVALVIFTGGSVATALVSALVAAVVAGLLMELMQRFTRPW